MPDHPGMASIDERRMRQVAGLAEYFQLPTELGHTTCPQIGAAALEGVRPLIHRMGIAYGDSCAQRC